MLVINRIVSGALGIMLMIVKYVKVVLMKKELQEKNLWEIAVALLGIIMTLFN